MQLTTWVLQFTLANKLYHQNTDLSLLRTENLKANQILYNVAVVNIDLKPSPRNSEYSLNIYLTILFIVTFS